MAGPPSQKHGVARAGLGVRSSWERSSRGPRLRRCGREPRKQPAVIPPPSGQGVLPDLCLWEGPHPGAGASKGVCWAPPPPAYLRGPVLSGGTWWRAGWGLNRGAQEGGSVLPTFSTGKAPAPTCAAAAWPAATRVREKGSRLENLQPCSWVWQRRGLRNLVRLEPGQRPRPAGAGGAERSEHQAELTCF